MYQIFSTYRRMKSQQAPPPPSVTHPPLPLNFSRFTDKDCATTYTVPCFKDETSTKQTQNMILCYALYKGNPQAFLSSQDFLFNDRIRSLSFIFSKHYLFNTRRYSVDHETLTPDEPVYWRFTFHHFGQVKNTLGWYSQTS